MGRNQHRQRADSGRAWHRRRIDQTPGPTDYQRPKPSQYPVNRHRQRGRPKSRRSVCRDFLPARRCWVRQALRDRQPACCSFIKDDASIWTIYSSGNSAAETSVANGWLGLAAANALPNAPLTVGGGCTQRHVGPGWIRSNSRSPEERPHLHRRCRHQQQQHPGAAHAHGHRAWWDDVLRLDQGQRGRQERSVSRSSTQGGIVYPADLWQLHPQRPNHPGLCCFSGRSQTGG